MAWDKGFNFRGSAAYVTDGANETYVTIADVYPVTRNGVTFGWLATTNLSSVDRDSTVDRRLAGINYTQPNTLETFQVDLSATGDHAISCANGDTATAQLVQYVEIFDNATSKIVLSNASVAQDTYYDATNVNRTEANWPSQNAASTQTFATTTFKMQIGKNPAGFTVYAHLFLSLVAAAAGQPYISRLGAVAFVPTYGRSLN